MMGCSTKSNTFHVQPSDWLPIHSLLWKKGFAPTKWGVTIHKNYVHHVILLWDQLWVCNLELFIES
jgi:hypothetical protein